MHATQPSAGSATGRKPAACDAPDRSAPHAPHPPRYQRNGRCPLRTHHALARATTAFAAGWCSIALFAARPRGLAPVGAGRPGLAPSITGIEEMSRSKADDRLLHAGEFLLLYRRGHWEFVRRPHSGGACFVIALTPQRELLLVEQYRLPMLGRTIELPAGIIGDSAAHAGESAETTALRELEEETGWRGARAELLFHAPTAAGLTSELSYFVRVHGLRQVHAGGGIAGEEDIAVHRVPLAEADGWLRAQREAGLLVDARTYAALHLLARE